MESCIRCDGLRHWQEQPVHQQQAHRHGKHHTHQSHHLAPSTSKRMATILGTRRQCYHHHRIQQLQMNGLKLLSKGPLSGWITTQPLASPGLSASTSWSSNPKMPPHGHSRPGKLPILVFNPNHWSCFFKKIISPHSTGKLQKLTTT